MVNWEYNRLDQLKVMNDSGDKVKYFEWLLPKLLPNGLSTEEHEAKCRKEDEDRLTAKLLVLKDDEESEEENWPCHLLCFPTILVLILMP